MLFFRCIFDVFVIGGRAANTRLSRHYRCEPCTKSCETLDGRAAADNAVQRLSNLEHNHRSVNDLVSFCCNSSRNVPLPRRRGWWPRRLAGQRKWRPRRRSAGRQRGPRAVTRLLSGRGETGGHLGGLARHRGRCSRVALALYLVQPHCAPTAQRPREQTGPDLLLPWRRRARARSGQHRAELQSPRLDGQ
jgi:hypothetical protein